MILQDIEMNFADEEIDAFREEMLYFFPAMCINVGTWMAWFLDYVIAVFYIALYSVRKIDNRVLKHLNYSLETKILI